MLPLIFLSATAALQLLVAGAAVDPLYRRNETATTALNNPGGPIVNVTTSSVPASTVSPGGPIVNVTSTSTTVDPTTSVSPGGPIINATSSINPGGTVINVTSTSITSAATSTATAGAGDNSTSSEFIACVSDSSIASLISTEGFNSTDRDSCSDTCVAEGTEQVAYFDDADNLCYCVSEDEAPSSGEVVYAVDAEGNCRSADDASVEYLYAPYPFSSCYLSVNTTQASALFSVTSPVQCFDGASDSSSTGNVTQTVGVRPQLNSSTKDFEYLCSWYPSVVNGTTATDCGFGITALYHA